MLKTRGLEIYFMFFTTKFACPMRLKHPDGARIQESSNSIAELRKDCRCSHRIFAKAKRACSCIRDESVDQCRF